MALIATAQAKSVVASVSYGLQRDPFGMLPSAGMQSATSTIVDELPFLADLGGLPIHCLGWVIAVAPAAVAIVAIATRLRPVGLRISCWLATGELTVYILKARDKGAVLFREDEANEGSFHFFVQCRFQIGNLNGIRELGSSTFREQSLKLGKELGEWFVLSLA